MTKATATAAAMDAINRKRFLSLILLLAVAVSMCACGASDTASASKPTPTVTPKYLWATEFVKADELPYRLSFHCFSDDAIYSSGYEKTGENIPEEEINKAKKEKKELVNDGRWDVLELKICRTSFDGKTDVLSDYSVIPKSENTNNWKKFDSVSGLGGLAFGNDRNLYSFEYAFSNGSSAPDDKDAWEEGKNYIEFDNCWYLRKLSDTGKELACSIIDLPKDVAVVQDTFLTYGDNFVFLITSEEKFGAALVNKEGGLINTVLTDMPLNGIVLNNEGRPLVFSDGLNTSSVYLVDFEKQEFKKYADLNVRADRLFSGKGTSSFYYSSGVNFYAFENGIGIDEFNWTTVNVDVKNITSAIFTQDGNTFFFTTADGSIAKLSRMYYSQEAERKALKLATFNPSDELISAVSDFNRQNYAVRIDIEDISRSCTPDKAKLDALTDYCRDYLGGVLPDIIDLSGLPADALYTGGMLEDLYPYIDADTQIKRDDFFSNVLASCERDGKLISTVAGFSINTVMGLTDTVGTDIGWTYDDYYRALSSMPQGSTGFDSFTTQDIILEDLLNLELSEFVNIKEKTCSFTDGRFEKLLKFVKTFPEYYDYASFSSSDAKSRDMIIRDGRQMLLKGTIYGFDDYMMAGYEFDGDITYVGFPTLSKTGNSLNPLTGTGTGNLAMTAACTDKASAWNFLRKYFTEEYQNKCTFFPANKNVFSYKLSKAMETTPVLSKKGEQLYDDDGQPRIYEVGTMYLSDFTPVPYYPITESGAKSLMSLVNSTMKVGNNQEDIFRIIKSNYRSENACEIIQNAVFSYLNK